MRELAGPVIGKGTSNMWTALERHDFRDLRHG
jgi:hypothetical protein